MYRDCLPPIAVKDVLADPGLVRELVEANGPYAPVQRYFATEAEASALAGGNSESDAPLSVVAPNFRGDWAYDGPLIDGVEPLLHHPGFADAARELFGAEVVRPQQVYSNITWQLPFHQGGGHTDIPAFRGFDRTTHPITFLSLMGHSGLFERERVKIATAVAWFYEGSDGGFEYWPDGPDHPSVVYEGGITNTALVADNDFMYHRARAVGRLDDGFVSGLTLDSQLIHRGGGQFAIEESGETRAEMPFEQLRISISWKAMVFTDEDEAALYDSHDDDLTLDEVIRRIADGLASVGIEMPPLGDDPTHTPELVTAMRQAWLREPAAAVA